MEPFRYPQFCPIARAAEVLGHRWVLPILRELFIGPQRFGDLRRRMGGVSTSVLSERLTGLERQGILARRELPAPAASVVYELTTRGQALEPAFLELVRWGTTMLTDPLPGERFEPDWLLAAARAFASNGSTPQFSFELCVTGDGPDAVVRGRGGTDGTRIGLADDVPADLRVRAPAIVLLGYLARAIPREALLKHRDVVVEGEAARITELPDLFDVPSANRTNQPAPENPTQRGATP
jgi:DNA-binding HxlR family transcriptional regulator